MILGQVRSGRVYYGPKPDPIEIGFGYLRPDPTRKIGSEIGSIFQVSGSVSGWTNGQANFSLNPWYDPLSLLSSLINSQVLFTAFSSCQMATNSGSHPIPWTNNSNWQTEFLSYFPMYLSFSL